MRILCSTGVFTRTSDPHSHEVILRYGPRFPVDGFEVIVYPRWYVELEQVARTLRAPGWRFLLSTRKKAVATRASKSKGSVASSATATLRG